MTKQTIIHNEICNKLFSNLPRYVSYRRLSEDTCYNWRTIKNHIEMMSQDYKGRRKIDKKKK
jgi:hypothetical protein